MPLTMAKIGEENLIKKIGGREETKRFLESLGFVVGSPVTVISEIAEPYSQREGREDCRQPRNGKQNHSVVLEGAGLCRP